MAKDSDAKQHADACLAAVQRLREHRAALLEEVREIDQTLERLQQEIVEILGATLSVCAPKPSALRLASPKLAKKDGELTVNAAVLQVIQEAKEEISKSAIRLGAMELVGAFSESALNGALMYWVDQDEIKNTSRGFYAPT
jgi:hypothetical protein